MKQLSIITAIALTASAMLGQASATLYHTQIDFPAGRNGAGDIEHINTSYDTNSQRFTFNYSTGPTKQPPKSGWVVVTHGDIPDPHIGEDAGQPQAVGNGIDKAASNAAILYMDFNTGQVTAYKYDSGLGSQTYTATENFIGYYNNAITFEGNSIGFSIDASNIQDQNYNEFWTGVSFSETIGIFGELSSSEIRYTYRKDMLHRSIIGYDHQHKGVSNFGLEGYATRKDNGPTAVNEPAGIAFIGIMMLGAIGMRRRKQA